MSCCDTARILKGLEEDTSEAWGRLLRVAERHQVELLVQFARQKRDERLKTEKRAVLQAVVDKTLVSIRYYGGEKMVWRGWSNNYYQHRRHLVSDDAFSRASSLCGKEVSITTELPGYRASPCPECVAHLEATNSIYKHKTAPLRKLRDLQSKR